MKNNIENIREEAKLYTNQTSILIVDRMKMPKNLSLLMSWSVFYLCGDVYKFTPDHATVNFHKPSRVFYVTSTYNKTTTDYIDIQQ